MAKGAKPRAAEDARLRGNPGKRAPRADRTDATPAPSSFDPPAHLSKPAKLIWSREIFRLRDLPYLKESDFSTFGMLCDAIVRYERANKVLEAKGDTYETVSKHGTMMRTRPEVAIVSSQARLIQRYHQDLAMTSLSRLRAASSQATATGGQLQLPLGDAASTQPTAADDPAAFLRGAIH